jgi:hypothetical protein
VAGLENSYNVSVLEQNTRLSRLFSGKNDDVSSNFDSFFGQVSNDPFAQVGSQEFNVDNYRAETTFHAIDTQFQANHNEILNIEPEHSTIMVDYHEPIADIYNIDTNISDFNSPFADMSEEYSVIADFNAQNDFNAYDIMPAHEAFVIDIAMPEAIIPVIDLNDVMGMPAIETFTAVPEVEAQATNDTMEYFDAALGAMISYSDMPVLETMVTTNVVQDVIEQKATVIEEQPSVSPVEALASIIETKAGYEQEFTTIQTDYVQDYTETVMNSLLQDLNVSSWDDMVLHSKADLDYAISNNNPLDNVLSQEIFLNDEGFSSMHHDLQNLTY